MDWLVNIPCREKSGIMSHVRLLAYYHSYNVEIKRYPEYCLTRSVQLSITLQPRPRVRLVPSCSRRNRNPTLPYCVPLFFSTPQLQLNCLGLQGRFTWFSLLF